MDRSSIFVLERLKLNPVPWREDGVITDSSEGRCQVRSLPSRR
jgi:hypothetical protein